MAKKFISPSLADLSQDIAGIVPIDLVQSWIESEGTHEHAEEALSGYKKRGTLVSSDTAGLSKLSQEKDLLEVMKLVSDPKEIVYGMSRLVGGVGVGRWVADNTQMFFPEEIPVENIVDAIHEANQRIMRECDVKLGFCIHHGEFLNFGDGFYGEEADIMEELAENHSEGGEILITESVANILSEKDGYEVEEKTLGIDIPNKVFSLKNAKGMPDHEIRERDYPIYFDQNFFNFLKRIGEGEEIREKIYQEYIKQKTIVLVQKKTNVAEEGLVGLLDTLVENTMFAAILKSVNKEFNSLEVKIAGSFAIFAFEMDEVEKSLEFAKSVREELLKDSLESIIGIESGEVLLFPITDDTWDIAGDPVNIASKQAQDLGKPGNIYITKKAAGNAGVDGATPYREEVSRVVLEGFIL